jgi:hypothetical protein
MKPKQSKIFLKKALRVLKNISPMCALFASSPLPASAFSNTLPEDGLFRFLRGWTKPLRLN